MIHRRPTGGVPGPITTNGDPRPTGGPPPPTFYSLGNGFDFWSCHHCGDRDQRERPFLLQPPALPGSPAADSPCFHSHSLAGSVSLPVPVGVLNLDGCCHLSAELIRFRFRLR